MSTAFVDRLTPADREAEARLPWWRRPAMWIPLTVYVLSRIVVVVLALSEAKRQIPQTVDATAIRVMFPTPASPDYWTFMTNWDGQWYREITAHGWPKVLPRDDYGMVDMNTWAFWPLWPGLVWGLMKVTGLPFVVAGPLLATILGAVAIVLLFRLIDAAVGRFEAIVVTVATCFYMGSPVMQASYTESLALIWVVVILLLIRRSRYGWTALAILGLALTRNIVLAMVPVMITHAVVAWRSHDEGAHPLRRRLSLVALIAWTGSLTLLWPWVAGRVTGVPDAYTQTLIPWRIDATSIKLGTWWSMLERQGGPVAQVAGVCALLFYLWFMLSKHSWRWGPELWAWACSYPAYMLLVINGNPSRIRYALLAFTFGLLIAWFLKLPYVERYRWWGVLALALIGVYAMAYWMHYFWTITALHGDILFP